MKKLPKGYSIEQANDGYWDYFLYREIDGSDTIVAMIICHDMGQWEIGFKIDGEDSFELGATQEDVIERYLDKQKAVA
jgi:hypothetical protein